MTKKMRKKLIRIVISFILLILAFILKLDNVIINVKEYYIKGNEMKRYIVEFEYRDVNYQLKGIMKETELQEIINNLIFL